MSALTTQFNVTALVPSVRRLYVDLWDTIELSVLGYYDADETEPTTGAHHSIIHHPTHHSQYPVPAIMRILRTSVLPELAEYLYFMVGLKPLAVRGIYNRWGVPPAARRRRRSDGGVMGPMLSRGLGHLQQTINTTTTLEEINRLRDAATTISAWKPACFLRQRGVGCLRCAICDCIDSMGDDFEEDDCGGTTTYDGMQINGAEEDGDGELHGVGTRNNSLRNNRHETSGRSSFLREFQKQVGGGDALMTPCQCPELVHRQCLERKLKLIPKYEPWKHVKLRFGSVYAMVRTSFSLDKGSMGGGALHPQRRYSSGPNQSFFLPSPLMDRDNPNKEHIAPRVWISYDNTIPVQRRWHRRADGHIVEVEEEDNVIAVDRLGRFRSSGAMCQTCGGQFLRTVRLPRSKWEVVAASLSDPISMMRAASTFIHFILACAFLAACEGMCADDSCDSHRTLLSAPLGLLKWPTTGLNGFALAWWQLQQYCMLHIFFIRRFAAIVDRLWMGPISFLYCRLYFYFIVTSALLAASYIPMVSRTILINFMEPLISHWILKLLQPVGDTIGLLNLFQYAVVSITAVCIFWRTHSRIIIVADGKEAAENLRRREELARNTQGVVGQRRDARQNINGGRDVAAHGAILNALPMQRIVGVGAGDNNAANHPIYHGSW